METVRGIMSYAKLKNKLDKTFSKFIRVRDKDKPCISCARYVDCKEAGHFIQRNNMALRWDEENVNGQCAYCNQILRGNIQGYENGLIDRYGRKTLERLKNSEYNIKIYGSCNLEDLIKKYKYIKTTGH